VIENGATGVIAHAWAAPKEPESGPDRRSWQHNNPVRIGLWAGIAAAEAARVPGPRHRVGMTCFTYDLPSAPGQRHPTRPARRQMAAALARRRDDRGRQAVRRVNGRLHLPALRAAMERKTAATRRVGPAVNDDLVNVA